MLILNITESKLLPQVKLEFHPWRVNILLGFNCTLKSLIAKSLVTYMKSHNEALDKGFKLKYEPVGNVVVKHNDVEVIKEIAEGRSKWDVRFIPDSRIVLRAILSASDKLHELIYSLKVLRESLKELGDEGNEKLVNYMTHIVTSILNDVVVSFITDYVDVKFRRIRAFELELINELKKIVNQVITKFRERGVKINEDDIMPLEVDVGCRLTSPYDFAELVSEKCFIIRDKRTKSFVRLSTVSTSVIGSMLFDYTIMFLSSDVGNSNKLLVIEEPEESLTPIQQVILTKFLENSLKILREWCGNECEGYILITTHSPYIVLPLNNPTLYYLYYDHSKGVFNVSREWPQRVFSLAELADLVLTGD